MEIPSAIDLNEQAVALYNQKKYEEALKLFDQAIQMDGKNPIFHKNKGDCLYDSGFIEEGLQSYRNAISLDRNRTPVMNLDFALLLMKQQNLLEALDQLLKVKLNPKTQKSEKIIAYKYLASIYLELLQYPRAKATISESIKEFPELQEDYDLMLILYRVHQANNEFGKQFKLVEFWMEKYSDKINTIRIANEFYRNHKMLGKIKRLIEIAKPYVMTNPDAIQQFALSIIECNDYEYLIEFMNAVKTYQGNESKPAIMEIVNKTLATWIVNRGNIIKTYRKEIEPEVINDVPKYVSLVLIKVAFCMFLKKYEDAAELFAQMIPQDTNHPILHKVSYYLLILGGKYRSAITFMTIMNPESLNWLHYFLNAYCQFKIGNLDKVHENWMKVLELGTGLFDETDPVKYFSESTIEDDIFGMITHQFKSEIDLKFP